MYNELEAWRTAVGRSSNTGAHTAQAARSAMRQLTKPAMDAMDVAIERARHCGVEVPMGVSMS